MGMKSLRIPQSLEGNMIYIVEDDRNIQEIELFALKNSG